MESVLHPGRGCWAHARRRGVHRREGSRAAGLRPLTANGPNAKRATIDQDDAPLLDALADYHEQDRYGFSPPGHRQGRGVDDAVLAVLGREPFGTMCWPAAGWMTARSSRQFLARAEELMADAVGAEHAFFSTCGSSFRSRRRCSPLRAAPTNCWSLATPQIGRRRTDLHRVSRAGSTPRWDAERHIWPTHPHPRTWKQRGSAPGSGRRADREPDTVRDVRRPVRASRGVPRARQTADRGRGLGCTPAIPRRAAHLGHGRRRRRLRGQRPQDGRWASSRARSSMSRATWSTRPICPPAPTC